MIVQSSKTERTQIFVMFWLKWETVQASILFFPFFSFFFVFFFFFFFFFFFSLLLLLLLISSRRKVCNTCFFSVFSFFFSLSSQRVNCWSQYIGWWSTCICQFQLIAEQQPADGSPFQTKSFFYFISVTSNSVRITVKTMVFGSFASNSTRQKCDASWNRPETSRKFEENSSLPAYKSFFFRSFRFLIS